MARTNGKRVKIMESKTSNTANTTRRTSKQQGESHLSLPFAYEYELHRLIQLSAYLLAEQDGFRQSPMHYWLIAEQELQLGE